MKTRILELLPEINDIQSTELREKVLDCYEDALTAGGWTPDDMTRIPFTLLIPNCPFAYVDHVRGVCRTAAAAAEEFNARYGAKDSRFVINMDILTAGALLHDVGKLLEYKDGVGGAFAKSDLGKVLRHPFSGAAIAYKHNCPPEVVHIIATHATEGDSGKRTPESTVLNKADFINFDTVKAFLNL